MSSLDFNRPQRGGKLCFIMKSKLLSYKLYFILLPSYKLVLRRDVLSYGAFCLTSTVYAMTLTILFEIISYCGCYRKLVPLLIKYECNDPITNFHICSNPYTIFHSTAFILSTIRAHIILIDTSPGLSDSYKFLCMPILRRFLVTLYKEGNAFAITQKWSFRPILLIKHI